MKQLRDLATDLVERRLWPVALALVVALVAVPVLLGRGGDAPAPNAAVPGAGATGSSGTGEKAEVTLDTSAPAERPTVEKVRDPFKAPKVRVAKTETSDDSTETASAPATASTSSSSGASTSTPASTGSSSGSTGAPSSTGSSTSGGTTSGTTNTETTTKPKPKTTTPTAQDASDTYHVSLRFGVNGGELKTLRDVARLSALPSVTDPFFVYLGVIETATTHQKRAVFLVSSDATPNGEGSCHPTKDDCESVELAVGQTAYFDYTAPGGTVTQYQLELAGIHKTEIKSEAKASAAFARHSVAGAELLRDAATRNVRAAAGARAYRYLPGAGMLARAKRRHVTAKAAAAGKLVPGLALLSRKHQPGIPVWHSPNK
jgi:hypothetical protein